MNALPLGGADHFPVIANDLLVLGENSGFHCSHPLWFNNHPLGIHSHLAQVMDDFAPHFIVAQNAANPHLSLEGMNIVDHVSRTAQAQALRSYADHGDRCFRRNPGNAPPDIFINHQVANDHNSGILEFGNVRKQILFIHPPFPPLAAEPKGCFQPS